MSDIAGKYELLRLLGKGGMAEVYLARQRGLSDFEKLVVVKKILPHLASDEEFVTMFLDEARTAADLRHPNVVTIFDIGEDEGALFMAMEFLHGNDIRRIQRKSIKTGVEVPLEHACQIIIDAAAGLHHAHTKTDLSGRSLHVVHRDVSPQNIVCTYDGATKILDFGIAKASSQSQDTQTGIVKGKYTYMSPEQALGGDIDARTDQFALAVVFWELLTMRRLFKRDSELATLNAITNGEVIPPMDYAPIPEELNDLILKALSMRREARFDSCEEFALALEDFLVEQRLAHSPARLGGFLKELFADDLLKEQELGIGRSDGNSLSASESIQPQATAMGRKKRERNQRSELEERAPPDELPAADVQPRAGDGAPPQPTELDPPRRERTVPPTIASELQGDADDGSRTDLEPGSFTPTPGTRGPLGGQVPEPLPTPASARGSRGEGVARQLASGDALGRYGRIAAIALAIAVIVGGPITWFATRPGEGEIVVRTTPKGATLRLNGETYPERTPLVLREVEVGRVQQMVLELDGYLPVQLQRTVDRDGEELLVETELQRLKVLVHD